MDHSVIPTLGDIPETAATADTIVFIEKVYVIQ